ncbi:MAG: lipid-A-disaccharide synthase [Candidatus Marinimicrobia bacterium]|jgi:lipid-A-disaccharide synthase|nr:lipid-A-disaccharide synthase [Candidatus Neomarinimicrobiota bacterium]MBT3946419.1 lipid-A-disaccharide synthase [Candidatus Neomarinimicrobiota bacterium]MBT4154663.1 lipid-A-disaccharide synthase [Candidatus Neomarinimicrobiota bacterium]MBT4555612.1 lipid-A-disaccharide synthase [Candidatus Neomarinimicrobiota bacterium]MBT4752451.1 lipid-A-disaccharide synthase [Candidatus Neomarinimicrobiota bacterium]|tara:strand:- start:22013 stop:23146 length:1134 start_codon:yes stop_codon:yes gene_type:complete
MSTESLKYFIVAGEPSGDLHGGKLIQAIQNINPNTSFMGHGGNAMKAAGMQILEHTDDLAMMGFVEVIKHLPRMMKIMGRTIDTISRMKPDRIILIDYPGFNLRLAKRIHSLKIPITYFILPQVWAWKEKRVETMKTVLDQSLSIFPFEEEWFDSHGLATTYVGHPFAELEHLDEASKEFYQRHNLSIEYPVLVLLPGSRQQEIDRHWPVFLNAVESIKKIIPDLQVMVGKASNVTINSIPDYFRIETNARKAMIAGTAALVSSGTATLECAVEDTPMIVCYKLSSISWIMAKYLTHIKYASMVNLIANKKIVPELLQDDMTSTNIVEAVLPLLDSKNIKRKKMLAGFDIVRKNLGLPGVYNRAATAILSQIKEHDD